MLDFEIWFFVLIGVFLATFVALNSLLFQPMLKVFKEREDSIDGARDEAQEMQAKATDRLDALKRDLMAAARDARAKLDELREEGATQQKNQMGASSKEALGLVEAARTEMKAESEKARTRLRADVEQFSDEIVNKLLKV